MRYKYIALLAIIVMFVGVMGIYKNNSDEQLPVVDERVESIYFVAQKDIQGGEIVGEDFFVRKTIKYSPAESVEEHVGALDENAINILLSKGAIAEYAISEGQVLTTANIKSLPEKLDSELISFPLSVSSESIRNPKIGDYGFVDLYLISNDNKIYREDFYQKRGSSGGGGKDYKDTRVKKFASNVWFVKSNPKENDKTKKIGLLETPKEEKGSNRLDSSVDTTIVYAYFNKNDIDSVIQAQVLGMFFASPAVVTVLNKPLANIEIDSREITASDIVSGAPLAEKKTKVIEIRGAKSSNGRN
ncbi:hypothetical protein GWD52_20030 [Enterobacteriaceae bacterium 4M9]|nr:hypothetical protein [Enterobacteriaceae bacterium 4M9]